MTNQQSSPSSSSSDGDRLPPFSHLQQPSSPSPSSSSCRRFNKFLPSFLREFKLGAKPFPLLICLSIGLIFYFAVPKPNKLTKNAWRLLSIFLSTISGLILSPLPVGAWVFACITVVVITKTLTFADAFSAFLNEVIWLIVASFFFSKGFVKTGLGERIAMFFVRWLGKSTLGLSYGLVLSEAAISPAMPSTTARAGGIFLPIVKSLAEASESKAKDPSSRKLGAFLVQTQLQASSSSSALFLTAAAQNMLCIKLADEVGVNIPNSWVTWFKASCLPALTSILLTPIIMYKIYPPKLKHTPNASTLAKEKLIQMGPIKRDEWLVIGIMLITVTLWILGEHIKMSSVVAAFLGLSLLLVVGVLDWDDCLTETSAWNTLIWFGILVGMAGQLNSLGVVSWLSDGVAGLLKSLSVNPVGAFFILQLAYFFTHYLFASQTAHVGALYSAFLGMHMASKVPGLLSALVLGYNTNLFGALMHYSSGQAVVYYGGGYVKLRDVCKLGIIMGILNLVIWGLTGAFWWKILGLY